MNQAFAGFHDGFAAALYGRGDHALARQPGFAIYRNTVMKGCVDALQANFPVLCRLVGEAWFREAAGLYAGAHPPRERSLLRYGADLPDFLQRFEQELGLPYLSGVARMDHAWLCCHTAADAMPLSAAALATCEPAELHSLRLQPAPAAWWQWFPAHPVYSIWDSNRRALDESAPTDEAATPAWRGEGALLVRTGGAVQWMPLEEAACAFLDHCRSGQGLLQAALESGLRQQALQGLFARCLEAGVFAAITIE